MGVEHDSIILNQMIRLLEKEHEAPSFKIESLYRLIFERDHAHERVWRMSPPHEWQNSSFGRTLFLIEKIVTQYVQLFQDPRVIPVTHYRRQKKISIHLDQQFGPVLREAARRTGFTSWMNDEEIAQKDVFLDEPILFLKQEARSRGFPRMKKGGGVSLKALRERYEMKLTDKGVRIGELEFSGPSP